MSKNLSIDFALSFEANRLNLQATGTYAHLPHHSWSRPAEDLEFRIFRHYPLSELEARSLHFKGSNPVQWIEEHLVDLVLLEGFQKGYDLRYVTTSIRYIPSFLQVEDGASVDGEPTPQDHHIYQWSHNRLEDVLCLTDNGIGIGRFPVRGPQNYLQLAEFEADVKSNAVFKRESETQQ